MKGESETSLCHLKGLNDRIAFFCLFRLLKYWLATVNFLSPSLPAMLSQG